MLRKIKCGRCGDPIRKPNPFLSPQYGEICLTCYRLGAKEAEDAFAAKQHLEAAAPGLLAESEKLIAWARSTLTTPFFWVTFTEHIDALAAEVAKAKGK